MAKTIWPVSGTITSNIAPRDGRMHKGIDIGAPIGTPVIAAASGTATKRSDPDGYGNYIVVDHGGGYETVYGHLSWLRDQRSTACRARANARLCGQHRPDCKEHRPHSCPRSASEAHASSSTPQPARTPDCLRHAAFGAARESSVNCDPVIHMCTADEHTCVTACKANDAVVSPYRWQKTEVSLDRSSKLSRGGRTHEHSARIRDHSP